MRSRAGSKDISDIRSCELSVQVGTVWRQQRDWEQSTHCNTESDPDFVLWWGAGCAMVRGLARGSLSGGMWRVALGIGLLAASARCEESSGLEEQAAQAAEAEANVGVCRMVEVQGLAGGAEWKADGYYTLDNASECEHCGYWRHSTEPVVIALTDEDQWCAPLNPAAPECHGPNNFDPKPMSRRGISVQLTQGAGTTDILSLLAQPAQDIRCTAQPAQGIRCHFHHPAGLATRMF